MTDVAQVDTPVGPGRLLTDYPPDIPTVATLMLGHGAGGGVEAADLTLLARRMPAYGVAVVRFEQPWRTAGKKVAVAWPRLDEGWCAAVDRVVERDHPTSLFFGGRSAGARVACRTAPGYDVAGVVCLAFPLHPPGRPDRSRAAELATPTVPRLVLQGGADSFGGPEEVRAAVTDDLVRVVELPGADHGFRLAKASAFTPLDLRELVVAEVREFLGVQPYPPPEHP